MSRRRKRDRGQGPGKAARTRRGRSDRKDRSPEQTVGFWGDPSKLPRAPGGVRITDDADAAVRSLGPPPLAGHEDVAEHYLAAVYERAVTLAGALAAVGGLVEPEDLG